MPNAVCFVVGGRGGEWRGAERELVILRAGGVFFIEKERACRSRAFFAALAFAPLSRDCDLSSSTPRPSSAVSSVEKAKESEGAGAEADVREESRKRPTDNATFSSAWCPLVSKCPIVSPLSSPSPLALVPALSTFFRPRGRCFTVHPVRRAGFGSVTGPCGGARGARGFRRK